MPPIDIDCLRIWEAEHQIEEWGETDGRCDWLQSGEWGQSALVQYKFRGRVNTCRSHSIHKQYANADMIFQVEIPKTFTLETVNRRALKGYLVLREAYNTTHMGTLWLSVRPGCA